MENEKFECCCGEHFNSKKELGHHKNYCKTYQKQRKQLEQEERDKLKLPNGKFKCKNPKCINEHDGSFGSGLFCSNRCKNVYLSLKSIDSPKAKAHRRKLVESGIFGHKRAPYGTWKCQTCDIIFNTKLDLRQHIKEKHLSDNECTNSVIYKDGKFICKFCGKEFTKEKAIYGHLSSCKKHPNKEYHDSAHKQSGKTYKKRISNGEIKHSGFVKGSHHTPETKEKLRKAALDYRKSCVGEFQASYNKKSIPILESISKEHGWHLQHAENGGEVRVFGYFLDAYDKENNVVVEYDEKEHYIDVENNILRPKDIERQNYIIEKLHCDFYRYNEYTKTLYKINT